jgi:hypothetical protein
MVTLENAWIVVLIVGGLILMPFLIANIRGEIKLSGYRRRAREAARRDREGPR